MFWEVDLFCWLLQPSRGHTPGGEAQSEILHGRRTSFTKKKKIVIKQHVHQRINISTDETLRVLFILCTRRVVGKLLAF